MSLSRPARVVARHQGFTLVELMIAMVLSALVLLSARAILEQLADSADRTTQAATVADRRANTVRTIRALFEHASASDSLTPFAGTRTMTQFSSWCDVAMGWTERCTVTVAVIAQTAGDSIPAASPAPSLIGTVIAPVRVPVRVAVWTSAGDTLRFQDSVAAAELRYLDDPSSGGHWRIEWSPGVTTPLAVGIVTPRDTTVLRIGERR